MTLWQGIMLFCTPSMLLLAWTLAHARDMVVNDKQQAAIYAICEKAARSPAASLEEIVSIAQFCLNWRAVVQNNDVPPKEPPEKDPEPKE